MDEYYSLYAMTWADCPVKDFGLGVDPRFEVELVRYGRLAALTSRVGLDRFDVSKLQEGTADLPWLSKVAVRHNEIIGAVARDVPVLPMRLGVFFESRSSLIAKLSPYEANAAEFLRQIEGRQEWAVKIYVDENLAQQSLLDRSASPSTQAPLSKVQSVRPYGMVHSSHATADGSWMATPSGPRTEPKARQTSQSARDGGGTRYLAAKGLRIERRRQVDALVGQAALTVETRLKDITDVWHRLRPQPQVFTNRPEKMVWNGVFLLARSTISWFQAICERLGSELAPKGLIVEVTGPWPPYHFCPSFEPQRENSPCP